MEFKFNKHKLKPNLVEYAKIFMSALITLYLFKPLILGFIPQISELEGLWSLLIWVVISVWFKGVFDMKWNGRDYF